MKVSAKTEYACLAMLELAARFETREPVRIREIADTHDIPSRFLVQILLQLKGAGYVVSTRGASGGYQLIKPPGEISLGEIMTVIDGPENEVNSTGQAKTASARVLHDAWRRVSKVEHDALYAIDFGELVARSTARHEHMFHI
jgi:Rrf2 family protein